MRVITQLPPQASSTRTAKTAISQNSISDHIPLMMPIH
jgi:hypothetical protein